MVSVPMIINAKLLIVVLIMLVSWLCSSYDYKTMKKGSVRFRWVASMNTYEFFDMSGDINIKLIILQD